MADSEVAGHSRQHVLVEHLADQTHVFVQAHLAVIEDGDTGRFLAAMLQ